ncbi:hypothetical protein AMAG_01110 [Allomyces macrogynus ATCC 38327]|uniref:Zinc/iron permease n=1 Tax=Allomyces macrogynus (strain ATCC 38327) TaxID=578462 RepID=A0A0L0RXW3_ALLM3|nr:hypothetical protein AMAG_01110 [Allomyces macrogynus ATCC 38327]|eukprot:KNE55193.1 hypothetical protein AMAG_01110 [Allomyces macrogynus ATCC 38327]
MQSRFTSRKHGPRATAPTTFPGHLALHDRPFYWFASNLAIPSLSPLSSKKPGAVVANCRRQHDSSGPHTRPYRFISLFCRCSRNFAQHRLQLRAINATQDHQRSVQVRPSLHHRLSKMASFARLAGLSAAMFVGSFGAGMLPLYVPLSESGMQLMNVFGAGMIVGTALVVILPEGVETLLSAERNESAAMLHDRPPTSTPPVGHPFVPEYRKRSPWEAEGSARISSDAVQVIRRGDNSAVEKEPRHQPGPGSSHVSGTRSSGSDHPPSGTHDVDLDDRMPHPSERAGHGQRSDHDHHGDHADGHAESDVHRSGVANMIGPALLSGFMLMFIIEQVQSAWFVHDHLPLPQRDTLYSANDDPIRRPDSPASDELTVLHRSDHLHHHHAHHSAHRPASIAATDMLATSAQTHSKMAATIGMIIHSISDGVAMGAASATDQSTLEMVVFFAILLHKGPSAFGLSTFLLRNGHLPRHRVRYHLLAFAAAAPLAAMTTFLALSQGSPANPDMAAAHVAQWTGILLLFSAGSFIYVATVHVLPEVMAHRARLSAGQVAAMLVGMVIPLTIQIGHKH